MKHYKPKIQHIILHISPLDLKRYTDFVGISEEYLPRTALLASLLKRRTTMSLLTTMPRTLKIFDPASTNYAQWLCDRANRPLSKIQYTPDNTTIGALEDKVGEILKKEGSRRTPRATFDAFIENREVALGEVFRDYKVKSINHWMLTRFGFEDKPLGPVRMIKRSDEDIELRVGFDTRSGLDGYVDDIKKWLESKGVAYQMEYVSEND